MAVPSGQASEVSQRVAESAEGGPRVFGVVGYRNPMVQVDFDLAPPRPAVLRQRLDHRLIVLLGRVKVGVTERVSVAIAERIDHFRVAPAPVGDALLLLVLAGVAARMFPDEGGFEVVGDRDDEVHAFARRGSTGKLLQDVGG